MPRDDETYIVQCPNCGLKNRIDKHLDSHNLICQQCETLIEPIPSQSYLQSPTYKTFITIFLSTLIIIMIVTVCFAIVITPRILRKDHSKLIASEKEKTSLFDEKHNESLMQLEARLQEELSQVDATKLRQEAIQHYNSILHARRSFDKQYALTSREKAQLYMLNLATDSTKSYHEAIKAVAEQASPQGSDIRISESSKGIALHIDFDMSTLTSGEHGTRTKHHTIESLKKEVITLISRVTNDVFQFCRDLDLDTIYVGCRHYVSTQDLLGRERDENKILYKIRIQKSRILKLSSDPFLDIYSTGQYFQIDEDNFSEIEIITHEVN